MVAQKNLTLLYKEPNSEQQEMINKELQGDEKKTAHMEDLIHQWIKLDPAIPNDINHIRVRNYIRTTKHNLERSKRKIENYLICKVNYPEIYSGRVPDSPQCLQAFNTINMFFSPKLTKEGARLGFFGIRDPNLDSFHINAILKNAFMVCDTVYTVDYSVSGEIMIFDCKGMTSAHLPKVLMFFKTLSAIMKESYTFRIKTVHIVHPMPMIEIVLASIKHLFHKNIKECIFVHKEPSTLHSHIDLDLLPSTYGGTMEDLNILCDKFRDILIENKTEFAKEEHIKYNGGVLPKHKQKSFTPELIEGSFRKLEID
ncbi:unnamed protein product [Brassicogethes aeneus]|uniref:CRAL-TRIO domain-containing protein n=1 Tax=Brassicogethes aeneus TaxID=1431903 RepID=A0A9P0AX59_BRAAE|nr:unnamed protein product [Brassicogethes aeneus]